MYILYMFSPIIIVQYITLRYVRFFTKEQGIYTKTTQTSGRILDWILNWNAKLFLELGNRQQKKSFQILQNIIHYFPCIRLAAEIDPPCRREKDVDTCLRSYKPNVFHIRAFFWKCSDSDIRDEK